MIKAGNNLSWIWPNNDTLGVGFAVFDESNGYVLVAYDSNQEEWPRPGIKYTNLISTSMLTVLP